MPENEREKPINDYEYMLTGEGKKIIIIYEYSESFHFIKILSVQRDNINRNLTHRNFK